MSLVFKDNSICLVDHASKTVSCDLFDLLAGNSEDGDGKAFEMANSQVLEEKQILKIVSDRLESSQADKIVRKLEV